MTYGDIIGLWPTKADFARDVGVKYSRMQQWIFRNSIPIKHFPAIEAAARRRGLGKIVTRNALVEAALMLPKAA